MYSIQFTLHALGYTLRRGFTVDEVETAIRESVWEDARDGKLECRMNFEFKSHWRGRFYETKQIRPVFVVEDSVVVVITVYTYFF